MEVTRTVTDGVLNLAVEGRLDGYWADHLDRVFTEAIAGGHHTITLDCAKVTFLSSAGVGVLVKFHQRLAAINGSLQVINASKPVSAVLTMTNLGVLLNAPAARADTVSVLGVRRMRRVERNGNGFDIYDLDPRATLSCREIGQPLSLETETVPEQECCTLDVVKPMFAIGVGAFGDTVADCRSRFGELISVASATAYQPADGTNVPDYLIAKGAMASDVRVLHGLACTGKFSHLVRFDSTDPGKTIGLSRLLESCLEIAEAPALGVVIVAEAAGLVGAALRKSPVLPIADKDFFAHPGVRTRLAFTSEPAFVRGVALAAGIVKRRGAGEAAANGDQYRPIGPNCVGHMHAAAFAFRPIRKGGIAFAETVSGLFEAESLQGVLHLLHDDRGGAGAGESEFVRGACWIAPVTFDRPATA